MARPRRRARSRRRSSGPRTGDLSPKTTGSARLGRGRPARPATPGPIRGAGGVAAGVVNANAHGQAESCACLSGRRSGARLRRISLRRRLALVVRSRTSSPADEAFDDLDEFEPGAAPRPRRTAARRRRFRAATSLATERPAAADEEDRRRARTGNPARDRRNRRARARDGAPRPGRSTHSPRRRAPPRRAFRARPRPRQTANPGNLSPRRRSPRPGHQGEHRHQGADPLDLHQYPRPVSRAHARLEPRRRLTQDRRRRPAPQATRDHERAQPAQGAGIHRQDRRSRAHQARARPRSGLPAPALESHPPPDQEVQGTRRRSIKNRT